MDFVTLESKKEEVVIMDNAQKAAKHFGTISYEMTTGLSKDIERVFRRPFFSLRHFKQ
jgi:alanine racemase